MLVLGLGPDPPPEHQQSTVDRKDRDVLGKSWSEAEGPWGQLGTGLLAQRSGPGAVFGWSQKYPKQPSYGRSVSVAGFGARAPHPAWPLGPWHSWPFTGNRGTGREARPVHPYFQARPEQGSPSPPCQPPLPAGWSSRQGSGELLGGPGSRRDTRDLPVEGSRSLASPHWAMG